MMPPNGYHIRHIIVHQIPAEEARKLARNYLIWILPNSGLVDSVSMGTCAAVVWKQSVITALLHSSVAAFSAELVANILGGHTGELHNAVEGSCTLVAVKKVRKQAGTEQERGQVAAQI